MGVSGVARAVLSWTRMKIHRLLPTAALLLTGCPGPASNDVHLDPPAKGFQLDTSTFDVPAGAETQRCFFFAVPGSGADPVWVNRVVATQNTGSHHLNVFRVKTIKALDGAPGSSVVDGECFKSGNWADWPLVTNLQNSNPSDNLNDWTLPDGVAHKFLPGEKLMLQIHYVNATTQKTPDRGHGIVNFHQVDAATVTKGELGTVFATNQSIKVCPGDSNLPYETSCTFAKTPVTIIGANGHFHSRGVKFEIMGYDKTTGMATAPFYTSTTWDDPPFAQNLNVQVAANGGIDWRCTYTMRSSDCGDPMNMCCATFGGHVETQEHCNAFIYYYPKIDNVSCF
jgi:Copper type II ascorbate-dependent monooxygenase, C-terminal domain